MQRVMNRSSVLSSPCCSCSPSSFYDYCFRPTTCRLLWGTRRPFVSVVGKNISSSRTTKTTTTTKSTKIYYRRRSYLLLNGGEDQVMTNSSYLDQRARILSPNWVSSPSPPIIIGRKCGMMSHTDLSVSQTFCSSTAWELSTGSDLVEPFHCYSHQCRAWYHNPSSSSRLQPWRTHVPSMATMQISLVGNPTSVAFCSRGLSSLSSTSSSSMQNQSDTNNNTAVVATTASANNETINHMMVVVSANKTDEYNDEENCDKNSDDDDDDNDDDDDDDHSEDEDDDDDSDSEDEDEDSIKSNSHNHDSLENKTADETDWIWTTEKRALKRMHGKQLVQFCHDHDLIPPPPPEVHDDDDPRTRHEKFVLANNYHTWQQLIRKVPEFPNQKAKLINKIILERNIRRKAFPKLNKAFKEKRNYKLNKREEEFFDAHTHEEVIHLCKKYAVSTKNKSHGQKVKALLKKMDSLSNIEEAIIQTYGNQLKFFIHRFGVYRASHDKPGPSRSPLHLARKLNRLRKLTLRIHAKLIQFTTGRGTPLPSELQIPTAYLDDKNDDSELDMKRWKEELYAYFDQAKLKQIYNLLGLKWNEKKRASKLRQIGRKLKINFKTL